MNTKKVYDDFLDYNFHERKNKEISQANIRKKKIRTIENNPKLLGEMLTKLNLTDNEYINFSFKEIVSMEITFTFCDLTGSDFTNAVLTNCDFAFANLQDCCFNNALLTNCNFRHTNLENADFMKAKILFCDFTGSNINLLKR